jgi:hypothetical protein
MTALTAIAGIATYLAVCLPMAIFVGKAIAHAGDGDPVSTQVVPARVMESVRKAGELADS